MCLDCAADLDVDERDRRAGRPVGAGDCGAACRAHVPDAPADAGPAEPATGTADRRGEPNRWQGPGRTTAACPASRAIRGSASLRDHLRRALHPGHPAAAVLAPRASARTTRQPASHPAPRTPPGCAMSAATTTTTGHAGLAAAADEDLIARVAGGDRDALGELYRRHRGWCRGYVLGRIARGDDADDVVQETFLRAAKQAGEYRANDGHPVPQWLCYLAGGKLIDYGRHEVHPYLAAARGAREQLRRPVTESAEGRVREAISERVQGRAVQADSGGAARDPAALHRRARPGAGCRDRRGAETVVSPASRLRAAQASQGVGRPRPRSPLTVAGRAPPRSTEQGVGGEAVTTCPPRSRGCTATASASSESNLYRYRQDAARRRTPTWRTARKPRRIDATGLPRLHPTRTRHRCGQRARSRGAPPQAAHRCRFDRLPTPPRTHGRRRRLRKHRHARPAPTQSPTRHTACRQRRAHKIEDRHHAHGQQRPPRNRPHWGRARRAGTGR